MIDTPTPQGNGEVQVVLQSPVLYVSLSEAAGIEILLPPVEDLARIAALTKNKTSYIDLINWSRPELQEAFGYELKEKLKQRDRFSDSPTYFAHLGSLAKLAGDDTAAVEFLAEGRKLGDQRFFDLKIGESLVRLNKMSEAADIYSQERFHGDIEAIIRLAYLGFLEGSSERAAHYVKLALQTEAEDWRVQSLVFRAVSSHV